MVRVELSNVWFQYPNTRKWVLKDVSVSIENNELLVVTGPNGSGKTTLLKIISLIYEPSRGSVVVNQRNFWELSNSEKISIRRKITYVHEKPVILRGSVLYNVAYGLIVRGHEKEEALKKSREMLEELGLQDYALRSAHELSIGEAQLVALARALVLNPETLVLDEPFAHLDSKKKEALTKLLKKKIEEGISVVISSHQSDYLRNLNVSKIISLEDGKIVSF
ncbi:MAG: energy-coupling factor ABC transporter ATP-binding protein [Desulfurococcaceae archaeon TW002]